MRALVCRQYGAADDLEIEQRDAPAPAASQLLVQVKAAGINFPDVLSIAGTYQVKTPLPFIPGNEASGIVTEVGNAVTRFKPGDQVICLPSGGAFAELCVVDEALAMPMIDGLDFAQAAGFAITYGTSFHALRQSANLQPGESLLVLGAAGGVGSSAVEIGRAMGATVIAAASSAEKLAFARDAGADQCINYTTTSLRDAVKEMTGGKGVNVVYDPVGGELAQQALRATAWHGRYLVVGFASGDIPAFPANLALLKEASIVGVWWGTWAARNPAIQVGNMMELGKLVAAGKLAPRVTQAFALERFAEAFATITERRARGKVVFTLN